MTTFDTKDAARRHAWQTLTDRGAARFPYPVEGRIPNFDGAEAAAERLFEHPLFANVDCIKVNPDSPQKYVRQQAFRHDITVFVPTPRLKGGFMRFDPAEIPEEHYADASMLSRWEPWAEAVELEALPQVDVIVAGCVAVTRDGRRCGKGEGYSDLEFAVLRELGHAPAPVVTTV
ncbi:MAG: 5-formyltetrahydrofolate cyclo-ligase, partial [Bradymonadaceae bacterium]